MHNFNAIKQDSLLMNDVIGTKFPIHWILVKTKVFLFSMIRTFQKNILGIGSLTKNYFIHVCA